MKFRYGYSKLGRSLRDGVVEGVMHDEKFGDKRKTNFVLGPNTRGTILGGWPFNFS